MITVGNEAVSTEFTTTTCLATDCIVLENISVSDPCACEDPENITNTEQFLFHDVLVIEATPMQTFTLISNDGNLLTATGIPISLGTPFVETSSGIYELEFFSLSEQAAIITVGNDFINSEFTTTICVATDCIMLIPTMSQWGLILFALLILNISVLLLGRLELKTN